MRPGKWRMPEGEPRATSPLLTPRRTAQTGARGVVARLLFVQAVTEKRRRRFRWSHPWFQILTFNDSSGSMDCWTASSVRDPSVDGNEKKGERDYREDHC